MKTGSTLIVRKEQTQTSMSYLLTPIRRLRSEHHQLPGAGKVCRTGALCLRRSARPCRCWGKQRRAASQAKSGLPCHPAAPPGHRPQGTSQERVRMSCCTPALTGAPLRMAQKRRPPQGPQADEGKRTWQPGGSECHPTVKRKGIVTRATTRMALEVTEPRKCVRHEKETPHPHDSTHVRGLLQPP